MPEIKVAIELHTSLHSPGYTAVIDNGREPPYILLHLRPRMEIGEFAHEIAHVFDLARNNGVLYEKLEEEVAKWMTK